MLGGKRSSLTPPPPGVESLKPSAIRPFIESNAEGDEAENIDDNDGDALLALASSAEIKYRKGTVENDQLVLLLDAGKAGCKETRRIHPKLQV